MQVVGAKSRRIIAVSEQLFIGNMWEWFILNFFQCSPALSLSSKFVCVDVRRWRQAEIFFPWKCAATILLEDNSSSSNSKTVPEVRPCHMYVFQQKSQNRGLSLPLSSLYHSMKVLNWGAVYFPVKDLLPANLNTLFLTITQDPDRFFLLVYSPSRC